MHADTLIRSTVKTFTAVVAVATAMAAPAGAASLPDPTSGAFCQKAQQVLANTEMTGAVTVFDNMPDYRASKPAPKPLQIYQVVTYDEKRPIAVSCKVKAADHLRAVYGEEAAGAQNTCSALTQIALDQAIRELDAENPPEVVARARTFVVDNNEPALAGQNYLQDFELSYLDPEGNVHLQSPGLQTDWDSLLLWIFPNRLRGQTYCHIPTVSYIKALATGALEPGTLITTTDDAPTVPQ